jgi:microcompartment protein CcmK/EutM
VADQGAVIAREGGVGDDVRKFFGKGEFQGPGLIVQPLDLKGRPEGEPLLALDMIGAGHGTRVVISNDGKGTREMVGDTNSPVRWAVIGVMDYETWHE